MIKEVKNYLDTVVKENKAAIINSCRETIADYLIECCEQISSNYFNLFDEDEIENDLISDKQAEEAVKFIKENYDKPVTSLIDTIDELALYINSFDDNAPIFEALDIIKEKGWDKEGCFATDGKRVLNVNENKEAVVQDC